MEQEDPRDGADVFAAREFTLGNDFSASTWRFIGSQDALENTDAGGTLLTLHFDGALDDAVSLRLLQAISLDGKVLAGDGIYRPSDPDDPSDPGNRGGNEDAGGKLVVPTGDNTANVAACVLVAFLAAGGALALVARRRRATASEPHSVPHHRTR